MGIAQLDRKRKPNKESVFRGSIAFIQKKIKMYS